MAQDPLPETRPAKRFVDALLAIVGVAILVGTDVWVADHWNTTQFGSGRR